MGFYNIFEIYLNLYKTEDSDMKLKRFFGVALTLCMLVGTFPQNVFAGDKSFGGRSQVKWDDSSVEKKRNRYGCA